MNLANVALLPYPGVSDQDAAGVARAKFVSRASTATYIDDNGVLQTAGVNVPRYQNGALLVEGAATNLLNYSTGMVANWTSNSDSGWSDNYGVAPDGTTTTTRAVVGGTRYFSGAVAPNTLYCYSIFYKKNAGSSVNVYADGIGIPQGAAYASLDLGTGQISAPLQGASSSGVEDYGTYVRAWITFITNPSATLANCHVYPSVGASEAWGADLKAGSLSSYIPTAGAPATRAADIVQFV